MQVASDLFVGGIPPDVRLSALTLSTVKYEPPFRGLLANLKLGERPPALLGSQGLRGAAADPLCAPARNPCANGGLCTVLAPGEVGCDCSHTGFGGKFCSEVTLAVGSGGLPCGREAERGPLPHGPGRGLLHGLQLVVVMSLKGSMGLVVLGLSTGSLWRGPEDDRVLTVLRGGGRERRSQRCAPADKSLSEACTLGALGKWSPIPISFAKPARPDDLF
ncbi:Neurexin-2-alpha [Tupaia chinensis]|uniref:Neurexin-2-alpha n=1 Tax=Tupaia chinensis TaxID=246437 RepID=L9KQU9_TUPCH|nr:Neurexin-2-alpha [Tupaia chinensis]